MTQGKKIGLKVRRVGRPKKATELPAASRRKGKKQPKNSQKKTEKKIPEKVYIDTLNIEDLVEELIASNKIHKQAEMKRRKIMWVSVSVLMFLIVVVWGYGLQRSFSKNKINSEDESFVISDWAEITDNIGQQLNEIKQEIDQIDSFVEESENIIASTTEIGFPEEQIIKEETISTSSEESKN